MKNIIILSLSAFSLTLSLLFERAPETTSAATPPAPLLTASILDFPALPAKPAPEKITDDGLPTYKDSLFYNYYGQTLGLRLNFTENKQLIETVSEWIGTPYRSGASSKKGTDCSGFVTRVYKEVYGINLTHSSRSMFGQVKRISKSEVKEGDLVFFRRGPGQPIYHVGIYLKNNRFVHSASNGGVRISSLGEGYYNRNFYAAGRAI